MKRMFRPFARVSRTAWPWGKAAGLGTRVRRGSGRARKYDELGGSYGFTAYVTAFHVRVVARTLRSRYGFARTTRTMRAIHALAVFPRRLD